MKGIHESMIRKSLLALALLSLSTLAAVAQPAPAANSDWHRVETLPPGVRIYVNGTPHTTCNFSRATPDSVTCTRGIGGTEVSFDRAGITSIKVSHRSRSALIGVVVGTGAGIGIGAAAGDPNVIAGRAAAAVVGAIFGAIIGPIFGGLTDFARTTVYSTH